MKKNSLLLSLLVIAVIALFLASGCKKEDPVNLPALNTLEITEITIN